VWWLTIPDQVRLTMKAIKGVLTTRWYAWEAARVAAMEDEEVNLYADPEKDQPAYLPKPMTEEADEVSLQPSTVS